MNESEVAFLGRVLDALPNSVAVLDGEGVILLVNRAWENGEGTGVGANYLDRCQGIREVMAGRTASFTREYPCDKPGGRRWCRLVAMPIEGHGGCLVQHEDITDLKVAEERDERARALFEDSQAIKLLIDPADGQIVDANASAAAFYGRSREELARMNIADINVLRPLEVLSEMEKAVTGRERQFRFCHRTASGTLREVDVYSSPIPWGGRTLLHSIVQDVTERAKAEVALRDREARFLALFELSPEGISVSRVRDLAFLQVNAAWEAMLGFTRDEALGRTPIELGLLNDAGELGAVVARLPASGEAPVQTLGLVRKDGVRLDVELKGMVLDIQGEPCILVILRDVTREASLKRTLLATEERFRVITGGLKDYILILDPDGTITYINRTPAGIPHGRALGRPFPSGVDAETQALGEAALRTCLDTLEGVSYSARGIRLDGTIGWFDIRLEPFLAEGELQFMVVLAFDRSDAKHAEEAERRAQKADSLVLMAGSIAHDFNNLFAAIQASLEILGIQTRGQPETAPTLATAREVLRRAIALSWRMNEFSGRAVTRRVPTDLAERVGAWAALQKPAAGRALVLDLRTVPAILADPDHIRIVLGALMENAWEAMEEAGRGGTVTLRTFVDSGREALPGPWAAPRPQVAETVCLEVANDGPCPGPEILARMFDPFFTTRFVGRGLGLASVLGLLQAHGAGIQVVPGEGLAFRMHFPPLAPRATPAVKGADGPSQNRTPA